MGAVADCRRHYPHIRDTGVGAKTDLRSSGYRCGTCVDFRLGFRNDSGGPQEGIRGRSLGFNRWHNRYGERDDVVVLSIHTVFEGHDYQTPERLREFVETWEIEHPVGIDSYAIKGDEMPVTMRRFRTGGTPHVVIVDKQGRLRFSHFGSFKEEVVETFIEQLLAEPAP